jgi:RNA polymerase sigma-70 factor (ECF subfamily)
MTIIPLSKGGAQPASPDESPGVLPMSEQADASAYDLPRVSPREPVPPCDEAELTRGLAVGDPGALGDVVRWLWEPLAAYAYRLLEDRDAAMDVAQEACLRLWERRGRDVPRFVRPYLFRTARNLAFDLLKTGRTRRGLLRRHGQGYSRSPERPDDVMQREQVATRVQKAIQELPERRREVFALAYLQGLSYAEVAEVLGISPKTVQNHMSVALAQLRASLRPLLEERRDDGGERPVPAPIGGPDHSVVLKDEARIPRPG